jgi:hypothetical protein
MLESPGTHNAIQQEIPQGLSMQAEGLDRGRKVILWNRRREELEITRLSYCADEA